MFCPFIKGDCVSTCIFHKDDSTCNLAKTIKEIELNTGSDQTESFAISNALNNISSKLDAILGKL